MDRIQEIKAHVGKIIKDKKLSLNNLSLSIGKSQTYLHKFVNFDTPKRLDEVTRKKLAQILEVSEQELTDLPLSSPLLSLPTSDTTPHGGSVHCKLPATASALLPGACEASPARGSLAAQVAIDIINATACCGSGVENLSENISGQWIISAEDFCTISHTATPDKIKMLRICGDSMEPTLKDGDWVLTDISRQTPESDGIYLLHLSTGLAVKRLQGSAEPNTIRILSDNQRYKDENAKLSDIIILGRIIYTLKAEKVG